MRDLSGALLFAVRRRRGRSNSMPEVDGKNRALELSMSLHSMISKRGFHGEIIVANALIDLYAKCGSMADAKSVFDQLHRRDVVSWTSLLLGYVENKQEDIALELLPVMESDGCFPDARVFVAAIKACGNLAEKEQLSIVSLERGMAIHSRGRLHESGNVYVGSSLVDMYSKCGSMIDAIRVFGRMKNRDTISWNTLIMGYAENGEADRALDLFVEMQACGCSPDARTFVAALKACSRLASAADFADFADCDDSDVDRKRSKMEVLEIGMALQCQARRFGEESRLYVGSSLVDVYSKCGSMADAFSVFGKMEQQSVVSWTALILGYAECGRGRLGLEMFVAMTSSEAVIPNSLTYVACLKACSSIANEEQAREVDGELVKMVTFETVLALHHRAARDRCDSDILLATRLIDAYAKSRSMIDAEKVFAAMPIRDVVAWNELILGYVENGDGDSAMAAFAAMREDCSPNAGSIVAALKACIRSSAREDWEKLDGSGVKLESLETGMAVHSEAAARGLDSDTYVANTLLDMYASCGGMRDANRIFDRIRHPGVVPWTTLIAGYTDNGQGRIALKLLSEMQDHGCKPDARTLAIGLKACGSVGALESGKAIHSTVCRRGLERDTVVVTCLIDFYAKCGSMDSSRIEFDALAPRDAVAWTALLAGYSRGGDATLAFRTFDRMVDEGVRVCGVGFQCLLAVCSHSGLVDKGRRCLEAMELEYRVRPGREHYHCVVDLLSRANQLEEALDMVEAMPFEPTFVTLTTVLSAWARIQVGIPKFLDQP